MRGMRREQSGYYPPQGAGKLADGLDGLGPSMTFRPFYHDPWIVACSLARSIHLSTRAILLSVGV